MRRFLIKLIAFSVAFFALNLLLGYALGARKRAMIEKGQYFPVLRWSDYHKSEKDTIDIMFLGSSLVYRGIDPFLADSLKSGFTFNMGSSSQDIATSYFVLKEVLMDTKVQSVVLDVNINTIWPVYNYKSIEHVFEHFRSGSNKWDMFWNRMSLKEKFIWTFPLYRYRNGMPDRIHKNFNFTPVPKPSRGTYIGKGHVNSEMTWAKKHLHGYQRTMEKLSLDVDRPNLKEAKYLRKIKALCDKNGIDLHLITMPLPESSLGMLKQRKERYDYIEQLCFPLDSQYRSYPQNSYLALIDSLHFMDEMHLNAEGSKLITSDIIQRIQ